MGHAYQSEPYYLTLSVLLNSTWKCSISFLYDDNWFSITENDDFVRYYEAKGFLYTRCDSLHYWISCPFNSPVWSLEISKQITHYLYLWGHPKQLVLAPKIHENHLLLQRIPKTLITSLSKFPWASLLKKLNAAKLCWVLNAFLNIGIIL